MPAPCDIAASIYHWKSYVALHLCVSTWCPYHGTYSRQIIIEKFMWIFDCISWYDDRTLSGFGMRFIIVLFTCNLIYFSIMSGTRRDRQLTEKGLDLLERNLRGKCASAIRSANVIANKLSPLLKTSDFADFELVRKYGDDFNLCLSEVVRCHENYCAKFAGDLNTIGEFDAWFHPRYEVLQSLHVYVQQWFQRVQCHNDVPPQVLLLWR